MRKAAAVIIGVDKTGGLDPLKTAARGAREVAAWLRHEGFDVACLTDGPGKSVTSQEVLMAINKFATKPPVYDILVVYFSGHGQWHARADHWLLSGAPQYTAEAINLEGAMGTARQCGIPNVVFISDACRTIPQTDVGSLVNGVDGFPSHGIKPISKIDYFKATSESRPAYEIPINGTEQSVLTLAILSTFDNPEPQIVKQIHDGVDTVSVVTNRLLETVLQARVNAILDGVDGNPIQELDTSVPSADDVYIARVRPKYPAAAGGPPPAPPPPLPQPPKPRGPGPVGGPDLAARRRSVRVVPGRAAADAVSDILGGREALIAPPDDVSGDEINSRIPDPAADHFETETGFIIRGARLADVAVSPTASAKVDLLNAINDPRGDAVRVSPWGPAATVVVRLSDGRCAVLAALRGYLGHAQFNNDGLANVAYVPSSNNRRWGAYNARRGEIDRLRALVAVAVDRNMFRVRSEMEAAHLAERIRVEEALDPTLGLYAAYAFAQAGMDARIRDILGYMWGDLKAELFDVLMLSGEARERMGVNPLVPFCPMLTQGWNLLRAYGVQLPQVLTEASRSLSNSLWSTFTGRGASIVFDAVKSGDLQ